MDHQVLAQLLGNYGEFVGAIAVVATLFYLALQVRHQAESTRAESYRSVLRSVADHNNIMWSQGNSELMIKGFQSFSRLSPAEKGRFDNLMANLFNDFEGYAVARGLGILDDALEDHWSWYLKTHFLVYPGVQEWWTSSQPLFPDAIREWVEKAIVDARTVSPYYGEVSDLGDA